jgi:hypothetical protein
MESPFPRQFVADQNLDPEQNKFISENRKKEANKNKNLTA